MKVIILAGGGGTRLFPLSRPDVPKQFLNIGSDKSLLAETVERYSNIVTSEDIIVVTNEKYADNVKYELEKVDAFNAHIVLEPEAKNTAPAIALAVQYCIETLHCKEDEVMFVCPADHIIKPQIVFEKLFKKAVETAKKGGIVTLGIKPTKPETAYGYIKCVINDDESTEYQIEQFVEKPNYKTAREYFEDGNYYWNSGMYCFNIGTFMKEIEKYEPDIYDKMVKLKFEEFVTEFATMPNISIDYAIAEKTKNISMLPFDAYWNDVGSWDAIYEIMKKDDDNNVIIGECVAMETRNSMIVNKSSAKTVMVVGMDNLIVVDTEDVIVILPRGKSQNVKKLVESFDMKK